MAAVDPAQAERYLEQVAQQRTAQVANPHLLLLPGPAVPPLTDENGLPLTRPGLLELIQSQLPGRSVLVVIRSFIHFLSRSFIYSFVSHSFIHSFIITFIFSVIQTVMPFMAVMPIVSQSCQSVSQSCSWDVCWYIC